ncbi:MAG: SagB-type dehydrogenase family enzyme [Gammaproteobacteria bacterium]|jgi:SagB-type dehydrogenase family enzyme
MDTSVNFKSSSPAIVSGDLVDAIENRRTAREFSSDPISLEQMGLLLWAAQGISKTAGKRSSPSAGGMYPVHLYVAVRSVAGIAPGLYAYDAEQTKMDRILDEDIQPRLADAAIGEQLWVKTAAAVVIVTANVSEMNRHFETQPPEGQRGARYAYIETGALAQNVHLLASAMNLGMVLVGGFDDAKVKDILKLPEELEPTALLCIGSPCNAN